VTLAATDRYKLPGTGVLVKALMAAANCFNFSAGEGHVPVRRANTANFLFVFVLATWVLRDLISWLLVVLSMED